MKKAIAILAVLVILVGAVFAAETHKIKIDANIAEVLPVYQMVIGTVTTNGQSIKYNPEATDPVERFETSIAQTLNFEVANTVEVVVNLTNAAKTTRIFDLTFSDGIFTVEKGVGADKHDDTVVPAITLATTHATGTQGIASIALDEDDDVATVTFNGTTCASSTTLVTATYSYTAHTDVNPGRYYADVQLDVAAR